MTIMTEVFGMNFVYVIDNFITKTFSWNIVL